MKPVALFSLLAATILLLCLQTRAQSPAAYNPPASPSDDVVSVQELAMPAKAERALEKGTSLLQKGDAKASLPFFSTAIQLAPSSYRAHHNLGLAYYRLRQLDSAGREFQKSIDVTNGAFAPSLFALSMVLYQRSQYSQAESLIHRGLFLNPGSALGEYCLGLVQYSLGQISDALQSALQAVTRDPAFADVHLLLARIHERQHNPFAVIADAQAYLKLDPRGSLQDEARKLLARAQQDLSPLSAFLN